MKRKNNFHKIKNSNIKDLKFRNNQIKIYKEGEEYVQRWKIQKAYRKNKTKKTELHQ